MTVLSLCVLGTAPAYGATVEDGVYSISCRQAAGYVALGGKHGVDPYICFISDDTGIAADGYWIVKHTRSGYTFCNEVSGEYLVFTPERVDAYYKYMTLSAEPEGGVQFWNIIENEDGTLSVQSTIDTTYWWNLRAGQGLLGTYAGSSRTDNERFTFLEKETDSPAVEEVMPSFPEALHVHLSDGRLEAYPLEYVTSRTETDGQLVIETTVGQTYSYALADVDSVCEQAPTDFPTFASYKFNNKFNDQLFTDAIGLMFNDTVNVTVSAIGKRLTPSFKLPDEQTLVYVDGELQESKVSSLRFDRDIYYLVARQGSSILLPTTDGAGYAMQPYGRYVRVHVDWLTDRAEGVPRIDINTADGQPVTSKEEYLSAEITIDGRGAFPSMGTTAVQIKGRGNSSWSWPKKPYRLKFASKVSPLGMTKGKSWVLLSNYQTGSLMANAIGMKAANLVGTAAPNHIVPVELYMNGEYAGSYNLTEKVGFANNSIELLDESAAALLELDSYYDEPEGQKFRSGPYNLPINVKEPDFSEGTSAITLETVETAFDKFLSALHEGKDISDYVDLDQLARYLMVNELICNYEFYHPKSTFCYRESFLNDTSKYVFGPVWDLDWAFGYEGHSRYFHDCTTDNYWLNMPAFEARDFVRDLRFSSPVLDETYKALWESFMEEDLAELLEFVQDYYDFAHTSFEHNRELWGDQTDYRSQVATATQWLQQRANKIYEDVMNDVRPGFVEPETDYFDNHKLYALTCRRGELVLNADGTALDAGQVRVDASDEEKQFAILNIEGKNYLYSPYNKKFLTADNTFVDELGSPCYFTTDHPDGDYQHMMLMSTRYDLLYVNNNTQRMVIDNWSTPDDGNRWIITPVADFDPTEALIIAGQEIKGDQLLVEDVSVKPGSVKEISVELNNPDRTYSVLEFNLSLPEGVSIAKDDNDEWMVTPNQSRLTDAYVLAVDCLADGSYKFLIYPVDGSSITGNAGELFKMTLSVSESSEGGAATFFNQLFADADAKGYEPMDNSFAIEIDARIPGDVNRDGSVTIADVTALVNIILGKDDGPSPMYDHEVADVNSDGKVTIADVTALVNKILGKK